MTKQEFLDTLKRGLSGLPQDEADECLTFYSEMIDERTEEGLSEEEAVAAIGPVQEIVSQVIADIPLAKITKERIKPKRRLSALSIVLIVLGSPIWLSLLLSAIAVLFSIYLSLWSVIVSLWAVFGSVVGVAFGGIVAGVGFALSSHSVIGIAMLGGGIFCSGVSIFIFFGCKAATKGLLLLTKKLLLTVKNSFIRRTA